MDAMETVDIAAVLRNLTTHLHRKWTHDMTLNMTGGEHGPGGAVLPANHYVCWWEDPPKRCTGLPCARRRMAASPAGSTKLQVWSHIYGLQH